MTNRELIKELEKLPPDCPVILRVLPDEYSELDEVSEVSVLEHVLYNTVTGSDSIAEKAITFRI